MISDDRTFRSALEALSPIAQRQLAAQFAAAVLPLSGDTRLQAAITTAARSDCSVAELARLAMMLRGVVVESYSSCGSECDWHAQAGHFAARAALACVQPHAGRSQAWEAAMAARMARTSAAIAAGAGTDASRDEAQQQYRLFAELQGR